MLYVTFKLSTIRKHILSDLRAYVCTFESCDLRMFEGQHEWWEHELQFHRKQWKCQLCPEASAQMRSDLETHVSNTHLDIIIDIDFFIQGCLMPRMQRNCPLCVDLEARQHNNLSASIALRRYREHLGRHMEQLAMAALPNEDYHSEGSVDGDSENDSASLEKNETISPTLIAEITERIKKEGILLASSLQDRGTYSL